MDNTKKNVTRFNSTFDVNLFYTDEAEPWRDFTVWYGFVHGYSTAGPSNQSAMNAECKKMCKGYNSLLYGRLAIFRTFEAWSKAYTDLLPERTTAIIGAVSKTSFASTLRDFYWHEWDSNQLVAITSQTCLNVTRNGTEADTRALGMDRIRKTPLQLNETFFSVDATNLAGNGWMCECQCAPYIPLNSTEDFCGPQSTTVSTTTTTTMATTTALSSLQSTTTGSTSIASTPEVTTTSGSTPAITATKGSTTIGTTTTTDTMATSSPSSTGTTTSTLNPYARTSPTRGKSSSTIFRNISTSSDNPMTIADSVSSSTRSASSSTITSTSTSISDKLTTSQGRVSSPSASSFESTTSAHTSTLTVAIASSSTSLITSSAVSSASAATSSSILTTSSIVSTVDTASTSGISSSSSVILPSTSIRANPTTLSPTSLDTTTAAASSQGSSISGPLASGYSSATNPSTSVTAHSQFQMTSLDFTTETITNPLATSTTTSSTSAPTSAISSSQAVQIDVSSSSTVSELGSAASGAQSMTQESTISSLSTTTSTSTATTSSATTAGFSPWISTTMSLPPSTSESQASSSSISSAASEPTSSSFTDSSTVEGGKMPSSTTLSPSLSSSFQTSLIDLSLTTSIPFDDTQTSQESTFAVLSASSTVSLSTAAESLTLTTTETSASMTSMAETSTSVASMASMDTSTTETSSNQYTQAETSTSTASSMAETSSNMATSLSSQASSNIAQSDIVTTAMASVTPSTFEESTESVVPSLETIAHTISNILPQTTSTQSDSSSSYSSLETSKNDATSSRARARKQLVTEGTAVPLDQLVMETLSASSDSRTPTASSAMAITKGTEQPTEQLIIETQTSPESTMQMVSNSDTNSLLDTEDGPITTQSEARSSTTRSTMAPTSAISNPQTVQIDISSSSTVSELGSAASGAQSTTQGPSISTTSSTSAATSEITPATTDEEAGVTTVASEPLGHLSTVAVALSTAAGHTTVGAELQTTTVPAPPPTSSYANDPIGTDQQSIDTSSTDLSLVSSEVTLEVDDTSSTVIFFEVLSTKAQPALIAIIEQSDRRTTESTDARSTQSSSNGPNSMYVSDQALVDTQASIVEGGSTNRVTDDQTASYVVVGTERIISTTFRVDSSATGGSEAATEKEAGFSSGSTEQVDATSLLDDTGVGSASPTMGRDHRFDTGSEITTAASYDSIHSVSSSSYSSLVETLFPKNDASSRFEQPANSNAQPDNPVNGSSTAFTGQPLVETIGTAAETSEDESMLTVAATPGTSSSGKPTVTEDTPEASVPSKSGKSTTTSIQMRSPVAAGSTTDSQSMTPWKPLGVTINHIDPDGPPTFSSSAFGYHIGTTKEPMDSVAYGTKSDGPVTSSKSVALSATDGATSSLNFGSSVSFSDSSVSSASSSPMTTRPVEIEPKVSKSPLNLSESSSASSSFVSPAKVSSTIQKEAPAAVQTSPSGELNPQQPAPDSSTSGPSIDRSLSSSGGVSLQPSTDRLSVVTPLPMGPPPDSPSLSSVQSLSSKSPDFNFAPYLSPTDPNTSKPSQNHSEVNRTPKQDLPLKIGPTLNDSSLVELLNKLNYPQTNDTVARTSTLKAILPFITAILSRDMLQQIGIQWSSTFVKCYYARGDCLAQSDFRWDLTAVFGSCFTYNFNESAVRMFAHPGPQYGLSLTLYTYQEDFICTTDSAGFKISLQQQTEAPFPETSGIYAMPGVVTSTIISRTINLKQDDCIENGDLNDYYYDGTYTVEGCMRSCHQKYAIDRCECADPRYPKPDWARFCELEDMMCLENFISCSADFLTKDQCSCKQVCRETQYHSTVTTSSINFETDAWLPTCAQYIGTVWNGSCQEYLRRSIAVVNIYYDRLSEVFRTEEEAYPTLNFLSDLFAWMGLGFGVCFGTVVEIGFIIADVIAAILAKITKRKLVNLLDELESPEEVNVFD